MVMDPTNAKHAHADERLRAEPIIWLATVRPDGRPHQVPVWFLWDGATILIFSEPEKQKIRNLRANPQASLALEALDEGGDIVVVEGRAELLDAMVSEDVLAVYEAKYARLLANMGWTLESMVARYSQAIRVSPTRLIAW
jgi:PPOX class probable F420-dependent enzyme